MKTFLDDWDDKKHKHVDVLTLCTAIKKVMEMMGGLKQQICKSTNVWV